MLSVLRSCRATRHSAFVSLTVGNDISTRRGRNVRKPPASTENEHSGPPLLQNADRVAEKLISQIWGYLNSEIRMSNIEGSIHKCLDKELQSTESHQHVYEAVIEFLIKHMWAQPAATVYDRMSKKGFISSDGVHVRMLAVLLADSQSSLEGNGSSDVVYERMKAIVSNPDFNDHQFLTLLRIAEDYNIRPRFIVGLIRSFMQGKGGGGKLYRPRRDVIAAWLRAAVKLGDVEILKEIFELGNAELKLAAIEEAWKVADRLNSHQVKNLATRLVRAVANPATKEADFLRAVQTMNEVGMDHQIVAKTCESFLANREADFVPSREAVRAAIIAFVQVDKVDQAFELLGIQPTTQTRRPLHRTFLAALRDVRPLDHLSFTKLLSIINDAGIVIDTSLFNVLISREVRLKRAANAVSMYNDMKQHPHLPPDSYTFGSLFGMYRRIRSSSIRRISASQRLAHPTVPLRQLYNEFVQSCKRNESPVRPNTQLLNAALRAFMRQRDYAGAIVAINTFSQFQVPLDNKTYYCVMKLVVRRIWAEVRGPRKRDDRRWVDRFLGVQHYSDIVLSKTLVHDLISAVRQEEFDISAPVYTIPSQARWRHRFIPSRLRRRRRRRRHQHPVQGAAYYSFPTMKMMESLVLPEPVDFMYNPIPLLRILARAVYASVTPEEEVTVEEVERMVHLAEGEMFEA